MSRPSMLARLVLLGAVLCASSARADDSFTRGLAPADFKAAGLDKLSPDELARLDALVRAQQSGAVAKAKEETTRVVRDETAKSVAEQVRQQVQAEDRKAAQKQAASTSFIDRLKVTLKPGTEIEYTTLDATLAGPFDGYRKGTVLALTNGQRWVVTSDGVTYESPGTKPVHVRIVPGSLGSFFMEIEGSGRPRVRFLDNFGPSPAAQPPASQ